MLLDAYRTSTSAIFRVQDVLPALVGDSLRRQNSVWLQEKQIQ
jgi:hypothetical protein